MEERTVWVKSTSKYNEFYLDDFDEDRYEQSQDYLSSRIEESHNKKKYDFDRLDEFISQQPAV